MPSPQRPWRTRSPSRNWRSPGMIGRAGGRPAARRRRPSPATADPAASRSSSQARTGRRSVPDGAPSAYASRLAARSRSGRNGSPGGRRPGPAAALPEGAAARRPATGVPNRLVRRAPNDEVEVEVAVVGAAELRPDHQLGRDLEQEPRRDGRLAHPPGRPPPGVRQVQPPLRPGDPDVGEPALLLELLLVVERPAVREEALLEAGDEHDRELEALGGVERDERHRVGVALVRVLVGDEGRLLEQPVERVVGREVVVAGRDRAQLEQVRPALLAVLGAVGEHRPVAGRLERLVEQLGQAQHADPRPQPADEDRRSRPARCASAARGPGSSPSTAASMAPHVVPPSRAAAARRTSMVLSPMPRAGTLMIRSKLTLSVSERRMRR